jgi:tetratricopeptide (TPR) repeat protein
LQPDLAAAYANLAGLLNGLRRFGEAEAACREALRIDATLAVAYCNLGNALIGQRRQAKRKPPTERHCSCSPVLSTP